MTWFPIETAPKDGTAFLALCENGIVEKIAWFGGWSAGIVTEPQEPCWGIAIGSGMTVDDEGWDTGTGCYLTPATPVFWTHMPSITTDISAQLRNEGV